ncbi:hypothetical protein C0Z16_20020 [Paraburkholderia rhynchosiae]|uniref:PAAR domain-containing protein n=1 Tax=Paraburkholderia rhynchosiae TaxID=487049 RepID=A0ABX4V573_9BURK|nr:hypothetical protein C0Z16_20020 [Paraburkholderia rhynchosiae]
MPFDFVRRKRKAHRVKRYYIRKGDRTTAAGAVTEGSLVMQCDGLPLAFEGDAVACPACTSTGKILCNSPRWPKASPHGSRTALNDDLCLCRCNPLPRLIASQSTMSVSRESSPADAAALQATAHVYPAQVATATAPLAADQARQARHGRRPWPMRAARRVVKMSCSWLHEA